MQPEKQTKKHEPPLSLHPMSFDEALDKLLKAKPNKSKPTPTNTKPKEA